MLQAICLFSLAQFFLALALVLRQLPAALRLFWWCVRGMLILSFRLYHLLLTRLAPSADRILDVDILAGGWRVVATLLLSLSFGLVILELARWQITVWSVGLLVLHGLLIGLLWDDLESPGDLQLGVRIQ